jgi:hypothetical protein
MQTKHAKLEALASARRMFAGDSQLAWRKISEFRSDWDLVPIAQPNAPDA